MNEECGDGIMSAIVSHVAWLSKCSLHQTCSKWPCPQEAVVGGGGGGGGCGGAVWSPCRTPGTWTHACRLHLTSHLAAGHVCHH